MLNLLNTNGNPAGAPGLSPEFQVAYETRTPGFGSGLLLGPVDPIAIELVVKAPPQKGVVARRPHNIGLVIDRSGSMQGGKLAAAIEAALLLLDGLRDGDRLAIVAFDDEVLDITRSVVLDDTVRAGIRDRLRGIVAGGYTALFDGFLRGAELVAQSGSASATESWVIVLSDGMGNQGLTDPAQMQMHAAELAARGIRTIAIGVGADYRAEQLTALSKGGDGEFHHASVPSEISEIVLGELRALRTATVQSLELALTVHGMQDWLVLGGHVQQRGSQGTVRFDRIDAERTVRVVILGRPTGAEPRIDVTATWLDEQKHLGRATFSSLPAQAPEMRDIQLACRAARLWHAHIVARALELNERHDYEAAAEFVRAEERKFQAYTAELPGLGHLHRELDQVRQRVGRRWESLSHKEVYVMAEKQLRGKHDYRREAPLSVSEAMDRDTRR